MPLVGFEPTISVGQRPQTCALDLAATGTGAHTIISVLKYRKLYCILYVSICYISHREVIDEDIYVLRPELFVIYTANRRHMVFRYRQRR